MDKEKIILVVEDSDLQREICIHQLKDLGFKNVSGATNGLQAMAHLEENPVDLVISDLEMPESDGLDLLTKIKATPKLKHIPFLLLTVYEHEESNTKMIELGAFDFLVKPSTPEALNEKLEFIFENKPKKTNRRASSRREGERRIEENDRRG
jgi:CheY-like chemotaxis protein